MGELTRSLVNDKDAAVAEGFRAVEMVEAMLRLAGERDLPSDGLCFQRDTFALLAHLRRRLLGVERTAPSDDLAAMLADYRRRYPAGYRVEPTVPNGRSEAETAKALRILFPLLLRDRMSYRAWDRLLLSPPLSRLQLMAARRLGAGLPRFVDKQGMATTVLLK